MADLAGVTLPGQVDGRSLAPVLRGAASDAPELLTGVCHGQTDNYWLIHEHEKYVYYPKTGEEQLFDLATDPQELRDCSAEGMRIQRFRSEMGRIAAEHGGFSWDTARLIPCRNQTPRALFGG